MIADVLAKELTKEYRREILVLTIHDSIATVDKYVEPVKSRFNDAFIGIMVMRQLLNIIKKQAYYEPIFKL